MPTLFEVEGGKVRAWVGMKMGIALSRRLGPKDTWRVMQTLGEIGAAPKLQDPSVVEALPGRTREAIVCMSRGQFLKGVGGAAVALSLLSGEALFPSAAFVQTTFSSGTDAQQTTLRSVVRNSRQFQASRDQQARLGVGFNLGTAPTKVSTYNNRHLGTVMTRSIAPQVRMLATFE